LYSISSCNLNLLHSAVVLCITWRYVAVLSTVASLGIIVGVGVLTIWIAINSAYFIHPIAETTMLRTDNIMQDN
jgi:hypothetical protein